MSAPAFDIAEAAMLLTRLADLLRRESQLIERLEIAPLGPLLEDKRPLAEACETMLAALRHDPSAVARAAPGPRAAFAQAVRGFETELARNRRQLEAARTVVERVLRLVARSVERADGRDGAYRPQTAPTTQPTATPALSLNQRI